MSKLVGLVNWKNISEVGLLLDGSEPLGSKLGWTFRCQVMESRTQTGELATRTKQKYSSKTLGLCSMALGSSAIFSG
jgi:hypothetical protein